MVKEYSPQSIVINNSDFSNEIFNAIEQSRVEAKGSISFKGI